MHIDPKAEIAGLPALAVRRFFRRSRSYSWEPTRLQREFRLAPERAEQVITELHRLGFIEPDPHLPGSRWRLTVKGNGLAMASAARPLHRRTADQKLEQLLLRVSQVNADDYYLYKVARVGVFGSYLSEQERINDIDVAVDLVPRESDPTLFRTLLEARIEQARMSGRAFGSITGEMAWPQTEVMLCLKSRSRALSLHTFDDRILRTAEVRLVFVA